MDGQFEAGLAEIKKQDPKRVVEAIYKLFLSIERMDFAEVIAAKRTLDLFRSLSQVDESGAQVLKKIDESLENRATIHYQDRSIPFDRKYHSIISAFGRGKCGIIDVR